MAVSNLNTFCVLLLVTCIPLAIVSAEILDGCNLQETLLDLGLSCLTQVPGEDSSSVRAEACCSAVNVALQSGHKCFCAFAAAASTNLQLTSVMKFPSLTLALQFPGCYLSIPATLPDCGVPVEATAKPVANKQTVAPMTVAPAAKLNDTPASNSSRAQNETHRPYHLVNVEPRTENTFGFQRGQVGKSNVGREMYDTTATYVWLAAIHAWFIL